MKRFIKSIKQQIAVRFFMTLPFFTIGISGINAQSGHIVTGQLIDYKSNQGVPYANFILQKISDSTLICGTISDESGVFTLSSAPTGSYKLWISVMGYKTISRNIGLTDEGVVDAGTILLEDSVINIKEAMVVADRLKVKSENNKTTFFVTKKMLDVSVNGVDMLRLLPGVRIDLMQNIYLEGSNNIQILVNGIERDKNFISQVDPNQIEKIEVINKPGAIYDGQVTGAINIILKKERSAGVNGQFNAEIPSSGSEIFISPSYTLNYGFKKLNLYTSYNGNMIYFDQKEIFTRESWKNGDTSKINTIHNVRQKCWTHRFNYGFDYLLNTRNQFNFYAFYNPYSQELDGNSNLNISAEKDYSLQVRREDTDANASGFYSLYYKHNFADKGSSITCDVSYYNLKTEKSVSYTNEGVEVDTPAQINTVKPKQNEVSIKTDFATPLGAKVNFSAGMKVKFGNMQDRNNAGFNYNEYVVAGYGMVCLNENKFEMNMGLRTEYGVSTMKNTFSNSGLSLLPSILIKYKVNPHQSLQFSYNRSVNRPKIYQLNPNTAGSDLYTISKGNPFLKPVLAGSLLLEHSVQFRSNYISMAVFYRRTANVICNMVFINDTGVFETNIQNMGILQHAGIQFTGSLKCWKATINPYLRIFEQYSTVSNNAKQYGVQNRRGHAFESGVSVMATFKRDWAASFIIQYASPEYTMQGDSWCDALYFLSLEKTFLQKIKAGIVSAIPFTRSFTYSASDTKGNDLYCRYEGKVLISDPFLIFKISYRFSAGKERERITRSHEEIDNRQKNGI